VYISLNNQKLQYNYSLYTGIFPAHLKSAVVEPLCKTGDKTSMKNDRPLSLLTVFSKVIEAAMHNRLSRNLHTNNILVTEQYCFRKRISTENAAFRLLNNKRMLEEFSVIWQRLLVG
jgi:hypothetical protein